MNDEVYVADTPFYVSTGRIVKLVKGKETYVGSTITKELAQQFVDAYNKIYVNDIHKQTTNSSKQEDSEASGEENNKV